MQQTCILDVDGKLSSFYFKLSPGKKTYLQVYLQYFTAQKFLCECSKKLALKFVIKLLKLNLEQKREYTVPVHLLYSLLVGCVVLVVQELGYYGCLPRPLPTYRQTTFNTRNHTVYIHTQSTTVSFPSSELGPPPLLPLASVFPLSRTKVVQNFVTEYSSKFPHLRRLPCRCPSRLTSHFFLAYFSCVEL